MQQIKCVNLLVCTLLFSTEIVGIGPQHKIQPLYNHGQSTVIKKLITKLANPHKIPPKIPPQIQKNFKLIKNTFIDNLQLKPLVSSTQYKQYENKLKIKKHFLNTFRRYFTQKTFLEITHYINDAHENESVDEFVNRQHSNKSSLFKENNSNLEGLLTIPKKEALYLKILATYLQYTYTLDFTYQKEIYAKFRHLVEIQRTAYMVSSKNPLEALKTSVEEVVQTHKLKNSFL